MALCFKTELLASNRFNLCLLLIYQQILPGLYLCFLYRMDYFRHHFISWWQPLKGFFVSDISSSNLNNIKLHSTFSNFILFLLYRWIFSFRSDFLCCGICYGLHHAQSAQNGSTSAPLFGYDDMPLV